VVTALRFSWRVPTLFFGSLSLWWRRPWWAAMAVPPSATLYASNATIIAGEGRPIFLLPARCISLLRS
jgi:hypothetical protein